MSLNIYLIILSIIFVIVCIILYILFTSIPKLPSNIKACETPGYYYDIFHQESLSKNKISSDPEQPNRYKQLYFRQSGPNNKCLNIVKPSTLSNLKKCKINGLYYDSVKNETVSLYRVPKEDPVQPNRGSFYFRKIGLDASCKDKNIKDLSGVYSFVPSDNNNLNITLYGNQFILKNKIYFPYYWSIELLDDNFYSIKSSDGKYLTSIGLDTGSVPTLMSYNNTIEKLPISYKWLFVPTDDNFYNIISADTSKSLELSAWGGTKDRASIKFHSTLSRKEADQKWKLDNGM